MPAVQIERAISAEQAKEFERQGAHPLGAHEPVKGLPLQQTIDRLRAVTERPALPYRAYLYQDDDPNAAALADGRIYISSGMIAYLAGRGARVDEPFDSASPRSGRMPSEVEAESAFILAHELAHTVAQHLVKRYRTLQQQALLMALVSVGAAAATRNANATAQQAGQMAIDAASLLRDVANSGYSQQDELEADQLGIRYVMRAGYDPRAALELLRDFARFDRPNPFLRTHPYIATRREHLQRYLNELAPAGPAPTRPAAMPEADERIRRLRQAQQLYPKNSVSWKNLQRQIDALTSN